MPLWFKPLDFITQDVPSKAFGCGLTEKSEADRIVAKSILGDTTMPRKNILAIAQRQALNIHVSIALMDRPIKIWEQVDELLQTLTGYPKFSDDVDFKPPPPHRTGD